MNESSGLLGGMTGGVDDLYREVILDHFKSPRNQGKLHSPSVSNQGANPLCGDEIEISALLSKGVIEDLKFEGHGCAISQASASMMTEVVKGKTIEEALAITARFKGMLIPDGQKEGADTKPIDLGDLEALEGVKRYAARVKCATLSWNTFAEALQNYRSKE